MRFTTSRRYTAASAPAWPAVTTAGNYQSAVVHVTKALGSCEAPTGDVSVSVGVSKENFNGQHGWHH